MIPSTLRRTFLVLALSFNFAAVAFSQNPAARTWLGARAEFVNTKQKLNKQAIYVVTIAHPTKRRRCLTQSIDAEQIVCTNHRHAITYRAEDVAALIVPGTHTRWYFYAAGFLAAGGAATWAAVVLAPACIPCAAATGVAALFLLWMAPMSAMATDDDTADTLLYLAPGQGLKVKLKRAG